MSPLTTQGGPFCSVWSLSRLASAAVVNYSKWNKNGTCLLADKSLTCPACGVTRVAWSTTKIQLTSGTAARAQRQKRHLRLGKATYG